MLKKIISSVLLVSSLSCAAAAGAAEIAIDEQKFYAYPNGAVIQTPFTSASQVNNVIPLEETENAITVKLTNAPENEIYFISVYDMETEKYITPNYGMPVTEDEFTVMGLTGGREYRLRISALFADRTLSGTVVTSNAEQEG